VTVIGNDKVGIIAGVSTVLADYQVNIEDISQTVMQNYFTMIMLVDLGKISIPFAELSTKLAEKGKEIGLSIKIQREDIFQSMHQV
ncbi:ACT domain-containing protein, partial [Thermodesulfobacteriota bacterium]